MPSRVSWSSVPLQVPLLSLQQDRSLWALPEQSLLVQARPGAQINAAMLQDFVRARLAEFKVPVAVLIVGEALPRNAGGKLVKSELRKAFGA